MVEGCTHTKQTFCTEDQFTVTSSSGIRDRDARVAEIVTRDERQVCPGHFWMLKLGKVPGSNSCVEKKFKLVARKYEEYEAVHFGNGD